MNSLCCQLLSVFVCAALLSGCSEGPDYQPASGTVTLDGEPFAGVSVTFIAATGPSSVGEADDNGKFVLYGPGSKPGILPGDYTAIIECPYDPNLGSSPDGDSAPTQTPQSKPCVVPEKYRQSSTSDLQVTISAGGNEAIMLELVSE